MDALVVVIVLAAVAWLALLTLAVMVLVRQFALLTLRLESLGQVGTLKGGLAVGSAVPEFVAAQVPELATGQAIVLLTSATCGPCHDFVSALSRLEPLPNVVGLLSGSSAPAGLLAELFPPWVRVIRDPQARDLAAALEIDQTPFAMAIRQGVIAAKSHVRQPSDLGTLIASWTDSAVASGGDRHVALV